MCVLRLSNSYPRLCSDAYKIVVAFFFILPRKNLKLYLNVYITINSKISKNSKEWEVIKKNIIFSPNYFLNQLYWGIIYTFKNASILSEGKK